MPIIKTENPGSYADELNKILKANNLPSIIIPDSQKIYNITPEQQTETSTQTPTIKARQDIKERRDSIGKGSVREGATNTACEAEEMGKLWKAKDIRLKLYTTKERGWPQNFGYNDLKEGLQNNSYKWTYEDINYSEEQVLYAVVEGNIKLKEC